MNLKPEEYDLDKPNYKLTVKTADGRSFVLEIGALTPDRNRVLRPDGRDPRRSFGVTQPAPFAGHRTGLPTNRCRPTITPTFTITPTVTAHADESRRPSSPRRPIPTRRP